MSDLAFSLCFTHSLLRLLRVPLQLSLGRQIIATRKVGQHLLWGAEELSREPIPPFSWHFDSHKISICNTAKCACRCDLPCSCGIGIWRLVLQADHSRPQSANRQKHGLLPSGITVPAVDSISKSRCTEHTLAEDPITSRLRLFTISQGESRAYAIGVLQDSSRSTG